MSNVYVKKKIARIIAILWNFAYRTKYRLSNWRHRYRTYAFVSILLILVGGSYYQSPILQFVLGVCAAGVFTKGDRCRCRVRCYVGSGMMRFGHGHRGRHAP